MKALSRKKVDVLSGNLIKNMMLYAFPVMLSQVLQGLYNAADTIIVGRYAGQEALSGVGAAGSLTALLYTFLLGLSSGASVVIGRALGANDETEVHRTLHTAMLISVIAGSVVAIGGQFAAELALRMIDVPPNVMPHALAYTKIVLLGKIPAFIYSFGAGIAHANGDSRTPLIISASTGVINVLLNILFVCVFHMDAAGVAWATAISQTINAICIIIVLRRGYGDKCKLYFKKLKIYKKQFVSIIRIGVPVGIQSSILNFANVTIQSAVNSFGSTAIIAAGTASANIEVFFNLIQAGFASATTVFVSQNAGAKQYNRIRSIVLASLGFELVIWVIEILLIVFGAESLIGIYIPDDAEAIRIGVTRLFIVGLAYGVSGFRDVFASALRALGYSTSVMLISLLGICGTRILWVYSVFPMTGTYELLIMAFPVSIILTCLINAIMFVTVYRAIINKKRMIVI